MFLSRGHWTTLMDAVRSGAVRRIECQRVDFTALSNAAFLTAVGCPGLVGLEVIWSVVPGSFVTDDLLRSSIAKGVRQLSVMENKRDSPHRSMTLHRFSEDAILDFFFRTKDAPSGGQRFTLELYGSGVTDAFLSKFLDVSSSVLRARFPVMFKPTAFSRRSLPNV